MYTRGSFADSGAKFGAEFKIAKSYLLALTAIFHEPPLEIKTEAEGTPINPWSVT